MHTLALTNLSVSMSWKHCWVSLPTCAALWPCSWNWIHQWGHEHTPIKGVWACWKAACTHERQIVDICARVPTSAQSLDTCARVVHMSRTFYHGHGHNYVLKAHESMHIDLRAWAHIWAQISTNAQRLSCRCIEQQCVRCPYLSASCIRIGTCSINLKIKQQQIAVLQVAKNVFRDENRGHRGTCS